MGFFEDFFKRFFPSMYREYNHFVGDVSKVSYISLEDYKEEINRIDLELAEIKVTLDYYSSRRKMLEDWKHIVEVKISKWNEDNTCSFCKYCNNLYCSKFNMSVDGGATCSDFEWR